MKIINKIAVPATFIFAVKKMFFDNYIDFGVIDKYDGTVFFMLLVILMACKVLNRKNNEK
jgi:hypothetical protein